MGIVGQECPTYGEAQQATSGLGGLFIVLFGTRETPRFGLPKRWIFQGQGWGLHELVLPNCCMACFSC